jgi:hypothetical protein
MSGIQEPTKEEEQYDDESSMQQTETEGQGVKNKYEVSEIQYVQMEIEEMSKKIESEKIKKRISEERYEKKLKEYNELQGKSTENTQEDKERKADKKSKSKAKKKNEKSKALQYSETVAQKNKEIAKQDSEAEILTKQINRITLENKELKEKIKHLRRQKGTVTSQLNSINKQNKQMEKDIKNLQEKNKSQQDKLKSYDLQQLEETEKEGQTLYSTFYKERDRLEGEYHHLIEENIKRERDRKKEQARKRQMEGMMARTVMNSKNKNATTLALEEQLKQLQNEEISDRTPILSEIVNKWKNVNKFKKQIIEKYMKNAHNIQKAFDEIMRFLCIEDYDDLPIIYEKSEEQLADIKMYVSKLENTLHDKVEKKKLLEHQIQLLHEQKVNNNELKTNFNETIVLTIDKLKADINEKEHEIKNMLKYFKALKPNTNAFLDKLNQTYLAEYVPNKIPLHNLTYNAENIQLIFDNVQNYVQLIAEFDAGVAKQNEINSNAELELLKEEIKLKLETFNKENFERMKNPVNKETYESSFKSGLKNIDFEQTMMRIAGEIAGNLSQANSKEVIQFNNTGKFKKTKKIAPLIP